MKKYYYKQISSYYIGIIVIMLIYALIPSIVISMLNGFGQKIDFSIVKIFLFLLFVA